MQNIILDFCKDQWTAYREADNPGSYPVGTHTNPQLAIEDLLRQEKAIKDKRMLLGNAAMKFFKQSVFNG